MGRKRIGATAHVQTLTLQRTAGAQASPRPWPWSLVARAQAPARSPGNDGATTALEQVLWLPTWPEPAHLWPGPLPPVPSPRRGGEEQELYEGYLRVSGKGGSTGGQSGGGGGEAREPGPVTGAAQNGLPVTRGVVFLLDNENRWRLCCHGHSY